jgi:hypothetical protein
VRLRKLVVLQALDYIEGYVQLCRSLEAVGFKEVKKNKKWILSGDLRNKLSTLFKDISHLYKPPVSKREGLLVFHPISKGNATLRFEHKSGKVILTME